MIIFILAIMIITSIVIMVTGMRTKSIWLAGIFSGIIILIVGFMYYFAKNGGLHYRLEIIFFMHPNIHRFFEYSTITIDQISRLLCLGRGMFLFFSAGFVISVSDILSWRRRKHLYWFAAIFSLLNYLIYEPFNYSLIIENTSDQFHAGIAFSVRLLNTVYVLLTVFLIFNKLKRVKTPWLKNKFTIIFITLLNLEFIFVLFGIVSPLQISHAIAVNHAFQGTLYYSRSYSLIQWYIITGGSVVLIVVGTIALWRYNKLQAQIGKPDMMLEKKLRENNVGVRVFTHGIKNQLLAQKVIIRNIKKHIPHYSQASEEFIKYADALELGNEQILLRMDELYNTFKTNRMRLVPLEIREIYDESIRKIDNQEEFPLLITSHFENAFILADRPFLVQSIYNILSNAFDAIKAKKSMDKGVVTFNCYKDGEMVILEIKDNGVGIERNELKKIFQPFYTQKNTNFNWGLGLSYVQQTIKAHFGYVRFESFVGKGTTFYVFLPIYEGETERI